VIPGVTSASAAAAQFNFSLTERGAARRVLFATGRTVSGAELDWRAAADARTTLCLYMGCAQIEAITQQLIAAGRAPGTPTLAAIDVERPGARRVQCALSELPRALARIGQESPVLIVVGEVSAAARRRHPIRDQGAQPDIPASPIWRSPPQCGGSKSVALTNPPSRICRKG
jgi:uroporphyrin-III C-methyltransferase